MIIPYGILIYLLLFPQQIKCQVDDSSSINVSNQSFEIEWVCYYPDPVNAEYKGFLKKFGEFLFGENPEVGCIKPISVYASDTGSFWVLDQGYENIIKVQNGSGELPRPILEQFPSLVGICGTSKGTILFTDSKLNKVFEFNPGQESLIEFVTSKSLSQPTGIAFSEQNNEIWVVETAAHRIAIFDNQGNLKRYIGQRGTAGLTFNFPTFIWIDKSGLVYIVDSMNFRIQILNDKGELLGYFGEIGDASGYFARPKGIATDSYGNIYVVDALFNAVQIFDQKGNFLYSFGEQGRTLGLFWMPTGIFIDNQDFIYVSDSYNARVQVFRLIKK